jgi:uncharacterized protein YndB with AHSA1/START domain
MVEVSVRVRATPEQVFAVIKDGWYFAAWVVGATRVRAVDAAWPAVGSRIHHSIGPWPLSLNDTTSVQAVDENTMIELDARAWPLGRAWVRITLHPVSSTETEVRLAEKVSGGPARLLPGLAQAILLRPRNAESVRRLADIAAGRAGLA